jgi:hydrogenase maturation protease
MRGPTVELAIIGCGHELMSDDGIGPRIVRRLARQLASYPSIACHDVGQALFRVVHLLHGCRKVLFVDAARMGLPAGTLRRFTLEQVRARKREVSLSGHHGDLLAVLDTARQLAPVLPEIAIFGIEPARLEPGTTLSRALQLTFDQHVLAVAQEAIEGLTEGECI